jgi:mannose-6-phosphate isomerase-like protein (cupin superfamily)
MRQLEQDTLSVALLAPNLRIAGDADAGDPDTPGFSSERSVGRYIYGLSLLALFIGLLLVAAGGILDGRLDGAGVPSATAGPGQPHTFRSSNVDAEIRRSASFSEFHTPEGCWVLEVANDPGDEAVSISRARVPPGQTTEWHRLNATDERYVIVSGHGRVEIDSLPPSMVGPGDVVRIPANAAQRITNTEKIDLVFFCICTPRFRNEAYLTDETVTK